MSTRPWMTGTLMRNTSQHKQIAVGGFPGENMIDLTKLQMEWTIAVSLIAGAILIYIVFSKDKEAIRGIYKQKGKYYYIKYVIFWIIFKLRSLRKSNSAHTGEVAGYGVKSKASVADMEQVQVLPDATQHPMAVDAVYFASSNKAGYYLVTATARRQGVPGVGLLELPLHPNTLSPESRPLSYSASGLNISLEEPMKCWNIDFDGMLRHTETGKLHQVKFQLKWTAVGPYFDFDTDMNQWATCDSMAREKWSKGLV
ncbi:hypothetical protein EB796_013275 [Bugula neritina]|uniref:Uncharacterized protein n=1 Tax=Bugula neritina TaxID=10212 RepID=A0A7J7JSF4_BUGNE|nr:hypothetical protein EB796_013275 [Bugula neritina]